MTELIWSQQESEPNRWFQRFELYRLLGPDRTLIAAVNTDKVARGRRESAEASGAWRRAAIDWNWKERAEAWDKYVSELAAQEAERQRVAILSSGFARQEERVRALNELAQLLLSEAREDNRRWLPDVKGIGTGDNFERIDIVRFNAGLLSELRGLLDDLAREVGGRAKSVELSGPGGKPIETRDVDAVRLARWEQIKDHLAQALSEDGEAGA